MGTRKEHEADCVAKLGKPFSHVHAWLDAMYAVTHSFSHRDIRHNREGIEEIRRQFGDEAAKAAVCHILLDWSAKDKDGNRVDLIDESQIPENKVKATILREIICAMFP